MIAARSRPRHPAVPGYAHRGLLARETAARSHLLAGHTRARQTRRPSPCVVLELPLRGADARYREVQAACASLVRARTARSCVQRQDTLCSFIARTWHMHRRERSNEFGRACNAPRAHNIAVAVKWPGASSPRAQASCPHAPLRACAQFHCVLQPYAQARCVQQRSGTP